MNRIPILASGAVLASLILCGGAVTVANAVTNTPVSQVLRIAGVSTTPTATPSATPSAAPTVSPAPSPSITVAPGDGKGVTVVKPSDPTKIGATAKDSAGADGKGCAHLAKHGAGGPTDPATDDPADATGHVATGTPVPQDPDPSASPSDSSGSSWSGSHYGTGGGKHHGGGTGGDAGGSTTGANGTGQ